MWRPGGKQWVTIWLAFVVAAYCLSKANDSAGSNLFGSYAMPFLFRSDYLNIAWTVIGAAGLTVWWLQTRRK